MPEKFDINDVPDTAPAPDRKVATTIHLDLDDHRCLRIVAAKTGQTAGSLIRRALRHAGVLPMGKVPT